MLGPHDWSLRLPTQGSSSDDTELRYSSQYEERLDPFSSFSKRVSEPGRQARPGREARRTYPLSCLGLRSLRILPALVCSPRPSFTLHPSCTRHQGSLHTHFGAMESQVPTQADLECQEHLPDGCVRVCDSEWDKARYTLWGGPSDRQRAPCVR